MRSSIDRQPTNRDENGTDAGVSLYMNVYCEYMLPFLPGGKGLIISCLSIMNIQMSTNARDIGCWSRVILKFNISIFYIFRISPFVRTVAECSSLGGPALRLINLPWCQYTRFGVSDWSFQRSTWSSRAILPNPSGYLVLLVFVTVATALDLEVRPSEAQRISQDPNFREAR